MSLKPRDIWVVEWKNNKSNIKGIDKSNGWREVIGQEAAAELAGEKKQFGFKKIKMKPKGGNMG